MRSLFLATTIALLIANAVLLSNPKIVEDYVHFVQFENQKIFDSRDPVIFLVGDIMLGRTVENIIEREGIAYPFYGANDMLKNADVTIGNFEGAVSVPHVQTPSMGFQFSIKDEFLGSLHDVGFDILSLSNNHSYDFGSSSLAYTRTRCSEYSMACGGVPSGLSTTSTYVHEVQGEKVGYIFLHTLYRAYDESELRSHVHTLKEKSDVQIAYVHWGDEYSRTHNQEQEVLARVLIDSGVDVVVGHHPHVVQDVEFYREKPIFYSLGNFIFDQYFSRDVEEMLALEMTISTGTILYRVIPLTSSESKSQPRVMETENGHVLITRILNNNGVVHLNNDGSAEFVVER